MEVKGTCRAHPYGHHHGGGGGIADPHGEEHGGQHEPQHQQAGARTLADSFINNLQPKQENLY